MRINRHATGCGIMAILVYARLLQRRAGSNWPPCWRYRPRPPRTRGTLLADLPARALKRPVWTELSEFMRARATVLNGAGVLAFVQGDKAASRALFEESLALSRSLADKQGTASMLNNLGIMAHQEGDPLAARALYEESLAIRRELGDKWGIGASLNNLGLVAQELGEYDEARSLHEESLAIRRELGDTLGIAGSLGTWGLWREIRVITLGPGHCTRRA